MTYESERAVFKDKVAANTKYYYMFRAVNSKGLVSNPSSIYEVELIKDADDSRVNVRIYNPPSAITERRSHKFQQLFQVLVYLVFFVILRKLYMETWAK